MKSVHEQILCFFAAAISLDKFIEFLVGYGIGCSVVSKAENESGEYF
jgi:hypothetical protein